MNGKWTQFDKLGMRINSLYFYEGFSRSQLLQFKDGQDRWLSDVFLTPFLSRFYFKYFRYTLVYVPSSQEMNELRGYTPNELLLQSQRLPFLTDVFYKKYNYKQSTMHQSTRDNIKDVIVLKDIQKIKGKRILLFDDLCTTGNTLKACYDLIKEHAKDTQVFALFHHEI